MRVKKIMIITFLCIIAVFGTGAIIHASMSNEKNTITEDEALKKLLEIDLGLNESIQDFSILGSDYNGMREVKGKESYMFSFMEKGEGGHITYNFAVTTDGKKIYRYDIIKDEYIEIQR